MSLTQAERNAAAAQVTAAEISLRGRQMLGVEPGPDFRLVVKHSSYMRHGDDGQMRCDVSWSGEVECPMCSRQFVARVEDPECPNCGYTRVE